MSTQPCGCDPAYKWADGQTGWLCATHLAQKGYLIQPISLDRGSGGATVAKIGQIESRGIGGAPTRASILPDDPAERKKYPIASGVFDYFPDALAEIAYVSWFGNEQHNPGQPLHWAREKSKDHEDCIARHTLQRGTRDSDGMRHTAKRAWRALAALQLEIEAEKGR